MFQPPAVIRLTYLWCGVLVLLSTGCQTYSPYGYGNYSGGYNSQYYQQPGQAMPYGSTGIPQGATVMPQSGFQGGYPSGGPPPGAYPPGAPAYVPGSVTPATPYPNVPNGPMQQGVDNSPGGLGQPGAFPSSGAARPRMPSDDRGMVPDYGDPDLQTNPRRSPAATPEIGDEANFKQGINPLKQAQDKLKGLETESNKPTGVVAMGAESDTAARRSAQSGLIQTAEHTVAAQPEGQLRPYGRAPNGHAWFRGLVDFDEQENTWYLIYNPEPNPKDPQGGTITLIEHPHLRLLTGDDVVLVEGQFDASDLDQHGQPKYRLSTVRRLIP